MLFFPDQHLGRNTGFEMGYDESDMRVWNPHRDLGGLDEREIKEARFLLWKGHCTVHQRFAPEHVEAFRAEHPDGRGHRAPRVPPRGGRAGRSRRLHRADHGVGERSAGGR